MVREEAKVVGKLHAHLMPEESTAGIHAVAQCHCGKQFYVDKKDGHGTLSWFPLDDSPHFVEYPVEPTEDNPEPEPIIGRYGKSIEELAETGADRPGVKNG